MGTNYYLYRDRCKCCGRAAEQAHIGKSSAGWVFSFQGSPEIRSYRDWLTVLEAGGDIVDEYGHTVTLEEFKALVEAKRDERRHHAREYPAHDTWTDADGHSFSEYEFT